jgi:hypothetical protein
MKSMTQKITVIFEYDDGEINETSMQRNMLKLDEEMWEFLKTAMTVGGFGGVDKFFNNEDN